MLRLLEGDLSPAILNFCNIICQDQNSSQAVLIGKAGSIAHQSAGCFQTLVEARHKMRVLAQQAAVAEAGHLSPGAAGYVPKI